MIPAAGDLIVVWFSCGAASAVAAKVTVELYGLTCDVRVVNQYLKEEDPDNRRFLHDVERWIGRPIEVPVNMKYPSGSAVDVWTHRRYMSGISGAPCTVELKKQARYDWEFIYQPDWHVLGFVLEEKKRYERFILTERDNVLPVLIDGECTKDDCFSIIRKAGLKLPRMYDLGYPNANCVGCVKATSPTYWNHVRKMHPAVFDERAKLSRELGVRLTRYEGERVFLDELPADAKGRDMKSMVIECGIFCEERPSDESDSA